MEPTIILCPGQGAQAVGMGKAWCEASAEAKAVFAHADRVMEELWAGDAAIAGLPALSELCFAGPGELLNRTDVSQPAIFVASVACLAGVKARLGFGDGELPVGAAAGLSLGEYTALHVAGAIGFEDGLRLVALRGRAMQEAAAATPSGMVALIGADEEQAKAVCKQARGDEVLVCANFNAPGQVVVSGSAGACERAVEVAEGMGLRAKALPVAGAFHSPIMAPAAERLGEALEATEIREPGCVVMANVTGEPHGTAGGGSMAAMIRQRLVEQLTSPVRWSACCAWLIGNPPGDGGSEFVELSPGKTLGGLMRRIDRGTKVKSYDDPAIFD
ncbi:Malonyl CoA-acyl carrier protein transacylase [hydrothermal vent metagenome]|uniref:Malonyl CoA-acyl carrier protein transacylase n=1 Tax=hydrothermal vent metagenome TaxID=652676 RepID=A0A3B1DLB2_9ZZZZ